MLVLLALVVLTVLTHLLAFKPGHLTLARFLPINILSFEWGHSFTASTISSHVMDRLMRNVLLHSSYNPFAFLCHWFLKNTISSFSGACNRCLMVVWLGIVMIGALSVAISDIFQVLVIKLVTLLESVCCIGWLTAFDILPPSAQRSILVIVILSCVRNLLVDAFQSISFLLQLFFEVFNSVLGSILKQVLNTIIRHIRSPSLISVTPIKISIYGHSRLHIR